MSPDAIRTAAFTCPPMVAVFDVLTTNGRFQLDEITREIVFRTDVAPDAVDDTITELGYRRTSRWRPFGKLKARFVYLEPTAGPQWLKPINDWIRWQSTGNPSRGTLRLRRHQLTALATCYRDTSPWDITTDQLVDYLTGRTWTPETLKSVRAAIASFYRWGQRTRRTTTDPTVDLPRIRVPSPLPRPADDIAVAAALAGADDRTRLMIMLAALAGLRAAEIAGVRFDDITETGLLHVVGKGGKARQVPLHPELASALASEQARRQRGHTGTGWRFRQDEVWLFGFCRKPIKPGQVSRVLSRVLGAATTGHQLRHRFATGAYRESRDLRAVQTLLGHSSPVTTARYTAIPDGALMRGVLGNQLPPPP